MGKKTDGEEDPDGWSKPIGKKGRAKKNKENADDFARLLPSSTRTGKAYQRSDVTKEDDQKVDLVRLLWAPIEMKENTAQLSNGTLAAQAVANAAAEEAAATTTHGRINAELKPEQLSIDTTAAQTVANAAAEKAAADAAAPLERAAAEQTVDIDAVEHAAAINADAEAATTANNLHEEIKRLQLLLIAEKAATAAASAAADNLEAENRRLQLLLAEHAATAADTAAADRVFVPGYAAPITMQEYQLQALHCQVVQLQQHLDAAVRDAQHWAYIAHMAETNYAAETAKAIAGTVPTREEHTRSQPRAHFAKSNHANQAQPVMRSDSPLNGSDAIGTDLHATTAATSATIGPLAKSNADTYAQAVMKGDPAMSPMKRSTRANDPGGDHLANAASSSATVGTKPAVMMSPTVLRHNPADNAKAAAMQAAADAAATAAEDPRILRSVLLAAAATASALARSIPPDIVTAHRRGGRPPPMRPRANPRPRPRRTRRPTGMHTGTPTAAGTSTARQSSQHSAFAKSPPRAGQARPQPGARPPRFDSTRSATLATRQIPPKVEPTASVMRLNARD